MSMHGTQVKKGRKEKKREQREGRKGRESSGKKDRSGKKGGDKGRGKGGDGKARKKKSRPHYTAATADRYELYQHSVQSADVDVEFLRDTYVALRGREPRHLREDFCGTALICCEWVKLHPENTAEGYDLDPEPLDWGKAHNLAAIGEDAARIELHAEDARKDGARAPDVRIAQNFSYWIFQRRADLLDYFRRARASLADDGIFVVDCWGGTETTTEMEEEREIDAGFTYVWDQGDYYPGTGEYTCHIHFRFPDGSEMKDAFSYTWRVWGMPELKDLLLEAGFSSAESYFEGEDEDDPEEGNGEFTPDEKGENCESWIAYIVARK